MNIIKEYKQYFTPLDLADFMVNLIPHGKVESIIDLSMGECGLLQAAKKRWDGASFYGVDIDESLLSKIHQNSPYIHTFSGDGLGTDIESWNRYQTIVKSSGGFDLAIANPPFNYYDQSVVKVDGLEMKVSIEIRFLLKYVDIVKENGYICIILPYGFLSLDSYKKLRYQILKRVTILKIIKIFDHCFDRIDADTCLILMQKKDAKERNIQSSVSIEYLDKDFLLTPCGDINVLKKNNRFDLEYHNSKTFFSNIEKDCIYPIEPLSKYVVRCKRGKTLAKKEAFVVNKGIRFLHTTDVMQLSISNQSPIYVQRNTSYFQKAVVAPGNILIGRVGKACIGKVAILSDKSARAVISDCIFGLEISNIDPYYLALYLASKYGQIQLKGLCKGSCSKYITKDDLLQLKIIAPEMDIQEKFREKYISILSYRSSKKKFVLLESLISELDSFFGKE